MKVLVAGSFRYEFYDEACASALERNGHEVLRFAWGRLYGRGFLSRIQERLLAGPAINRINNELANCIKTFLPDVVFITRGVPIKAETITLAKKSCRCIFIANNNDDPFGGDRGRPLWRHFLRAIPEYDLHFVFRAANVTEYQGRGARFVRVLKPYFVPELHYPITLSDKDTTTFGTDVVFIGHAKEDDRIDFFRELSNEPLRFRIYGLHWDRLINRHRWLMGRIQPPLWGLDYTRAIRAARIALVCFTRRNRDTYTRRSFEIPSIGTCMLSYRTADMVEMFREGREALYFDSARELVQKVRYALANDLVRDNITVAARRRLEFLGASVDCRMNEVIEQVRML